MNEQEIRDALAAAICPRAHEDGRREACDDCYKRIDVLLMPVVRRIVAAELRAAAKVVSLTPGIKFHGAAVRDVLARADELDPR